MALNIRYANDELVKRITEQTGRRANLIAIVCNELLPGLGNRRVIESADVERALDSQEIRTALAGWGTAGDNTTPSRLDRIIVYATIEQAQFSAFELWQQLDGLDVVYQPEQVNESLTRLELAFILKREQDRYYYRVPLFGKMLKMQGVREMLTRELAWFKRENQ